MKNYSLLLAFMLLFNICYCGPLAGAICSAGCASLAVACYAGAGAVFGTVTAGVGEIFF